MYPLDMRDLSGLEFKDIQADNISGPIFLKGDLMIDDEPCDTFIRLDGFNKGFVMINGVNIGRYFNSAAPQKTLYVPAPFLKKGNNQILIFESDSTLETKVVFCDTPEI